MKINPVLQYVKEVLETTDTKKVAQLLSTGSETMNEDIFKFAKAVGTCMKGVERGIVVSFECPVCQSTAQAVKSEYNGHVHAECKGCGFKLME